ncbi:MAG: phosphonate ABC transporter, permease protein PhnE [Erysipelotrichaceae bacterium]|nr:phosphonate ABC transporter, permease protein PhnE [Erysipelotrichaceae bacterium]MDD3924695.1 phosphonate ABC transporter, permease protein PhnE [Erysipelotrichaceae bacterium]MDD4643171.1 phosphonate ABC transporter, permease protein PhnE [Erysipelotrichaceae bacterium]
MLNLIKKIFLPDTFVLSNGKSIKEKFNWGPYITIVVVILVIISAQITNVDINVWIKNGKNFVQMIDDMFPPNFDFFSVMFKPMVATIMMSLLGTLIAAVLALPVSFYLSSNPEFKLNKYLLTSNRTLLGLLRTLPVLVYAKLIALIFGSGAFSGMIAIAIFTFPICVKMMYEQIETVDMGPYEAMISTGASRARSIICSVFPQVKGYYYSTVLYNFEMNVRSAAILGYVGAGGIGVLINTQLTWRAYSNTGLMLIVLVLTVIIIESTSRYLRRKLV